MKTNFAYLFSVSGIQKKAVSNWCIVPSANQLIFFNLLIVSDFPFRSIIFIVSSHKQSYCNRKRNIQFVYHMFHGGHWWVRSGVLQSGRVPGTRSDREHESGYKLFESVRAPGIKKTIGSRPGLIFYPNRT